MVKKALIIGINYIGSSSELNGCINDAVNIKKELKRRGYLDENITVLTDNSEIKPTRNNILMKLLELILSGNEELFFHYSGHGSYIKDTNGDEEDGKDECLVPLDYYDSGMIIDDEIRGILCSLSENQNLTCILDCCHSGSGIDLAYNLYERNKGEYFSLIKDKKLNSTRGKCIMLSGSKDSETSADAFINGNYQGAMTYSFLKALQENINSYEELIRSIRKTLRDGEYSQHAQFSSGKKLNLKTQFKI
jgi:hypothetical protein